MTCNPWCKPSLKFHTFTWTKTCLIFCRWWCIVRRTSIFDARAHRRVVLWNKIFSRNVLRMCFYIFSFQGKVTFVKTVLGLSILMWRGYFTRSMVTTFINLPWYLLDGTRGNRTGRYQFVINSTPLLTVWKVSVTFLLYCGLHYEHKEQAAAPSVLTHHNANTRAWVDCTLF